MRRHSNDYTIVKVKKQDTKHIIYSEKKYKLQVSGESYC